MNEPRVTVVITCHEENPFWVQRAIRSVALQVEAPDLQLLVVADKATEEVKAAAIHEMNDHKLRSELVVASFGDLGDSRNRGASMAEGKYVSFLDADDAYGCRWIRQAYEYARTLPDEDFVLHPEFNVFFGAQNFLHRHIGDDSPEFDARGGVQFNPWSALAFAPRSVLERFPYRRSDSAWGYEDFRFNMETLGAGIKHRVVPASVHYVRMKLNQSSMALRFTQKNLVIPKMALFDRRDLPNVPPTPAGKSELPGEVMQQTLFVHRDVGERQVIITQEMMIRQYPPSSIWDDQAWLRDKIGNAKRVVLVDNLLCGGAEKYAIDFAKATGAIIVETNPSDSGIWRAKARVAGVEVVSWQVQKQDMNDAEKMMAVQRALIQCELDSLFICNSRIGWALVHDNAEPLAKKVFCASFATIPIGGGMESCPPFFLKNLAPNLAIITDNEAHAKRMRDYNGANVIVLPPRCDYDGPSKRSQIAKKRLRVLWAGRGSPEKNPQILPAVAALLEDKADIHVWGDVQPMNGPENLKYRGPFDGFASIDGSYDVYLLTSITEGMPNTAMEAVMADIPVVGPEIGGLPELAATHYRGDPTAIAQAILHAAEKHTAAPKLRVQQWRDDFDTGARAIVGMSIDGLPGADRTGPAIVIDQQAAEVSQR